MLSAWGLGFATPWVLAGLAVVPLVWWLLRVVPPLPRQMRFPAVRLVMGLDPREDSVDRTPWWVLALRLLLLCLVIIGLAQPVLNPQSTPDAGAGRPLLLVVDDGWAAAADWTSRRGHLLEILDRAERDSRPVALLTTAPPVDGGKLEWGVMMPAGRLRPTLQALLPKPWPSDRAAALAAIRTFPRDQVTQVVWVSDGMDDAAGNGAALAAFLQGLGGGVQMVLGRVAVAMLPVADGAGDRIQVQLRRPSWQSAQPWPLVVRALDDNGRVLGRAEMVLDTGQASQRVELRLPTELRNRLARLDVDNQSGAASVLLADEQWRRRPVGLVGGEAGGGIPLLGQLYYVDRALTPFADLYRGEAQDLLDQDVSVLVMADGPALTPGAADRLVRWVDDGGVMIRFAGPQLALSAAQMGQDPLLPVRLRDGGRNLGGAMSWTSPQHLSSFGATGPFADLEAPSDIVITAQVLAEPGLDLADRTWARLADGTPLVTGRRQGKGWLVLIHTSANAEWGNLALSGLFVDMLRRLVALSDGLMPTSHGAALQPVEVLDGLGHLVRPGGAVATLTGDPAHIQPGPRHPPGLYGDGSTRVAVNLGPLLPDANRLVPPQGIQVGDLDGQGHERPLRPVLLAAAVILAALDLLLSLALRGLLRGRAAAVAAVSVLVMLGVDGRVGPVRAASAFDMEATLETRLAFIRTGDARLDNKALAGLKSLSRVIGQRSTAQLADPMGVDIEQDPVLFFPLLYWPVSARQEPPSPEAAAKLNAYMRAGGLIVIDTGADDDSLGEGNALAAKDLIQDLSIPPLTPVTQDHVLTRSFYLLKELPGRVDAGPVWVAGGNRSGNDGVSPVVVGANDWIGAWAGGDRGRPLLPTVPGGERQRELAFRFGVNLVMYALTGNYKADQVHLPAILDRLGR